MTMATERSSIIRCGLAGVIAVRADTARAFPRHTHDQFGLGVVERGAQRSLSGRGVVEAGRGDTITVNPGEVHDGIPIGGEARAWTMLYFDPAVVAGVTAELTEGKTAHYEFTQPVIHHAGIAVGLRKLFFAATTGDSDAVAMLREEVLLMLFSRLLLPALPASDAPTSFAIRHARTRIDHAPALPVSLDDLARETGLSHFQLIRGFARETGLPPHAYLLQRRLQQARSLIVRGMPLVDVAAASGFADQSHLNRLFLRNFGVTPGAYARAVA
jgi:AraC-like DNA-binding protein